MKKNITINLCGTLYAIDEDAYSMLEQYLNSMKNYFSRQEGGEEIADDIEHRVAELLWQEKEAGAEAINVDMVKNIIKAIGNPAEFDVPSEGATTNTNADNLNNGFTSTDNNGNKNEGNKGQSIFDNIKNNVKGKRFYRISKYKVLGGVCTGLSEYFGTLDPVAIRIAVALLSIIFFYCNFWFVPNLVRFFIPIMYLILWLVVPEARTAEDFLRMKGKEVTPENLQEEILGESHQTNTSGIYDKGTNNIYSNGGGKNSGCLKMLVFGGLFILMFPLIIFVIAVVFFAIVISSVSGIFGTAFQPFRIFWNGDEQGMLHFYYTNNSWLIWFGVICAIIIVAIPIFLILRYRKADRKPMGAVKGCILSIVWIIAVIGCFVSMVISIDHYKDDYHFYLNVSMDEKDEDEDEDTLKDDSFLNELGWEITCHDGCYNNRYFLKGEFYDNNEDTYYLDACNIANNPVQYTALAKEFVEEGVYRLVAKARAETSGAYIYAYNEQDRRNTLTALIPPFGNKSGNIWKTVYDKTYNADPIVKSLVKEIEGIVPEDDGHGWSFVYIDSIKMETSGTICYGVTTQKSITKHSIPYRGWLSATDFELVKIQ